MPTSAFKSCLLGLTSLIGLIGCVPSTHAARWVDVSVLNRTTGERLTPYRHDGKIYVAGSPGDKYGIEIRNKDGARVLTVIAVDGVNVLTGQTAAALQSGYVLDPGQPYSITGWRKNMDEVAQFLFTALPNSYAARTGRPDNVGVIGVAVFREKMLPPPIVVPTPARQEDWRARENDRPASPRSERRAPEGEALADRAVTSAAPAPALAAKSLGAARAHANTAANSATDAGLGSLGKKSERSAVGALEEKPRQRLGTGHGEREHAPTRGTEFVRASDSPDEVIAIYYDSRANLIARGIIRAPRLAEPRPFPGGFVPDPQG